MRYILLVLLVFVFPASVFWAINGMATPADTWVMFSGQLDDIRRSQPEPVEEEPIPEPPSPEDPDEREPEEREPEIQPVEKKSTPIELPSVTPLRKADRLFVEGLFAEAVAAYGDTRARRRALAHLGEAFAQAFPTPDGEYLVVQLRGGSSTLEGYNIGDDRELKLLDPTGSKIGLPATMIASRRNVDPDKVIQRTRPRIEKEAASNDPRRLFRATAAAFRIGRPDLAAPLLERLVKADQKAMLKAIRTEAEPGARDALFRAYSDAVFEEEVRPEPVVTTSATTGNGPRKAKPKRGNGGSGRLTLDGRKRKPRRGKMKVQDEQARKLLIEARPYSKKGKSLYEKISAGGLKDASLDDVEAAIRNYEKALDLYEKAREREDSDPIYALVTGCSKKLFQLRFWKEQVGGR